MRRRAIAGAGLVLVVGVAVVLFADPFGRGAPSAAGADGATAATSTATIERRDLSSQTQVSATLGYGDASTVAVPAGTAPASLQQAEQQQASSQATLHAAEATLAGDRRALTQARATLAAGSSKLAVDCRGSDAAQSTACTTDAQSVASNRTTVTQADAKVTSDVQQVASARLSLTAADRSLQDAEASAAMWGQTSIYTELPKVGDVVRRGETLYAISGQPVVLLYGSVTAWRAFAAGMTPGADIAELNANLAAYGAPTGDAFTSATAAAIRAFQSAHGLPADGRLLLGAVVFESGPVRVTSVTPSLGTSVQAGPVLGVTSTRRVVTISLDASSQTSVKVGDPVVITLPDQSTTPGRVTSVGTVATTPAEDNGSSTPTIAVAVTPTRPSETGRLDQAPVDVSITTETRRNVLVAPVNALLALASGGYALEVVGRAGTNRLVPVQVGLFDDSQGLVEVSGPAVHEGLRVVVPGS